MSASLEASLRLEIAQYQASLAKAKGDAQKFKDAIKKTGNGLGGDLFGKLQGQFGGLLPAMGISAVVGGFKHITNSMDDLADTALRLNESTEVIQRVGYASEILAGVNAEGLTTSFLKLEKALGDIENSAAIEALADLGISAEKLAAAPLDEKVLMMSDAFQKARATGTGYNDILALLGKSAGDLIPMFMQTRETIQATFDGAHIVPDEEVQRLAALNDQIDGFLAQLKSLATEGAASVVGFTQQFADSMGTMVGSSTEFLKALLETGSIDEAMAHYRGVLDLRQEALDQEAQAKSTQTESQKAKPKERAATAETKAADTSAQKEAEKAAAAEAAQNERTAGKAIENAKLKKQLEEEGMTRVEKIAALEKDIAATHELEAKASAYQDAELMLDAEKQRLELQREMVKLKQQEAESVQQSAEDIQKEAQDEAEKKQSQQDAKKSLAEELQMAQAKASGNSELVAQMERELRIRAKAKEIQDSTGANADQARAAASTLVGFEDAASAEKTSVSGKKGMRRRMMGGGVDDFNRLQSGGFGAGALSKETGSLTDRARRNADKADAKGDNLTSLEGINQAQLDCLKILAG